MRKFLSEFRILSHENKILYIKNSAEGLLDLTVDDNSVWAMTESLKQKFLVEYCGFSQKRFLRTAPCDAKGRLKLLVKNMAEANYALVLECSKRNKESYYVVTEKGMRHGAGHLGDMYTKFKAREYEMRNRGNAAKATGLIIEHEKHSELDAAKSSGFSKNTYMFDMGFIKDYELTSIELDSFIKMSHASRLASIEEFNGVLAVSLPHDQYALLVLEEDFISDSPPNKKSEVSPSFVKTYALTIMNSDRIAYATSKGSDSYYILPPYHVSKHYLDLLGVEEKEGQSTYAKDIDALKKEAADILGVSVDKIRITVQY